jgi:putative sterol carrier protein
METPKTEPTAAPSETGTVLGAFQMLASRLDGKQPGLNRTLKFDFGDQVYRIVFTDGHCQAVEGDGEAAATVRLKMEDAVAFLTGKLNPMTALMTGKIKVEGDMMSLLVLQSAM